MSEPKSILGRSAHGGDLFQLLRDGLPRTRAELASMTGLARSTIVARIDALLQSGMITAADESKSTGGRPSARVVFNPNARIVVAVSLGATHCIVAVTNLDGEVLARRKLSVAISRPPATVLRDVLNEMQDLLSALGPDAPALAGVGIGLPGPVEHATGRPIRPPIMPGWDGFDVVGQVRQVFDVLVLVDNEVNLMALGERSARWRDHENMIFVKVATGVGGGIIANGQLQRGAQGSSGDLGHVQVPQGGNVICHCGNTGCLEALVGAGAIVQKLSTQGIDVRSGADVVDLASEGHPQAIAVLRDAGRDLGSVLATCVNLLNPSVIVIGGSTASGSDYLLAGVREVVYKRSLPLATAHLTVVPSASADEAGVVGAATMVIEHSLSPEALASASSA